MQNMTGKEFIKFCDMPWSKPSKTRNQISNPDRKFGEEIIYVEVENTNYATEMVAWEAEQARANAWNEYVDSGKPIHVRYVDGLRKGSVYELTRNKFIANKDKINVGGYNRLNSWESDPIAVRMTGKKRERRLDLYKEQDDIEIVFDYTGETVEVKVDPNTILPDIFDDNGVQINIDDYALGTYREYIARTQGQYRTHFTLLKLKKITPKMVMFVDDNGNERRGDRASFALYRIKLDSVLASAAALSDSNILDIAEISLTLKG